METILIEKNFLLYQFPPRPEQPQEHWGTNIYALLHAKQALLIDSGFPEHASAVRADLAKAGYEVQLILLSHFHSDHILGLKSFPGIEAWGSAAALPVREPPFRGITGETTLEFGEFTLTFRPAPGHSPCSMFTVINRRFVHVGDNLIAANDGTPILPWAEFKDVSDHIRSLEALPDLEPVLALPGHGKPFPGGDALREETENRLKYLRAVRDGEGRVSVEQATAGCTRPFLCYWHIQRD